MTRNDQEHRAFPTGKTSPPQTGAGLIPRENLVDALAMAVRDKALTLIVAPAGYGKTVLLAALFQHLADTGHDAVWYNCDRTDVVPQKLNAFLHSRFTVVDGLAGTRSLGLEASASHVANALITELERRDRCLTLILENYHLAQSAETNALVEALLQARSSHLKLVVSSRARPTFASRKLALQGQVEEFRASDLAFTSTDLLALAGIALPHRAAGELAGILERTEGWPLAVRLFLLALDKGADRTRLLDEMAHREADVLDYLTEEVLTGQPAELQAFLVSTSFLDQISPSLCAVLLPDMDSRAHLLDAEQKGLFLSRVEAGSEWWRYHPMFRQCLLAHFARLPRERQASMQKAASQWFEDHGLVGEAVGMAIASGDDARAAALLGRLAPELVSVRGDLASFLHLLDRLPQQRIMASPTLQFWQAWALFFARKYREAAAVVAGLRRLEAAGDATSVGVDLQRQIGLLDTLVATFTDDMATCRRVAAAWLADYPQADAFDRATVACALVLANLAFLDLAAARRAYDAAQRAIAGSAGAYGIAWVCAIGMTMDLVAGEPLQALARLDGMRSRLSPSAQAPSNITATLDFLAAAAHYHLGRLDEASDALLGGGEHLAEHGVSETACFGIAACLRVAAKTSGVPAALAQAQRLEALLVQAYAPRLWLSIRYERVLLLFRAGRYDEGREEAAAIVDVQACGEPQNAGADSDLPCTRELRQIASARTAMAEGTWNEGLRLLSALATNARHGGRQLRYVQALVLKASVYYAQGNATKAVRTFLDAISIASQRGLIQLFLDDELICRPLVAAALHGKDSAVHEATDDNQLLRTLAERFGVSPTSRKTHNEILAPLEPLTARETAMLDLLLSGMRNREIAASLSTSEATVKWHLYNLYSKLGVNNRTAAIHRARALGLGSS